MQEQPESRPVVQASPPQSRQGTTETAPSSPAKIGTSSFEIQATTEKAREELKAVHGLRAEAEACRARAQQDLNDSEATQAEAESIMLQAHNTLAKAVALNPEALSSMVTTVRMLEEAIRTERQLRQHTRQDAEEETERARQKATDTILNALSSVRMATNYVNRELEEAKRIASTAEALKLSSEDDLRRVQAIMGEAETRMREEAQRLLDQPWGSLTVPPQGAAVPPRPAVDQGRYRPPPKEPAPETLRREFDSGEAQREAPSQARERPATPVVQRPPPAARPHLQESSLPRRDTPAFEHRRSDPQEQPQSRAGDALESALNEFLRSVGEPEPAPARDNIHSSGQASSGGLFLDNLDLTRGGPSRSQSRGPISDDPVPSQGMEHTHGAFQTAIPSHADARAEFGDSLLAEIQDSLATIRASGGSMTTAGADVIQGSPAFNTPEGSSSFPASTQRLQSNDLASTPGPAVPVSGRESYSGILRILLTPAADTAVLSTFWDVIDSVAGVGKVISQTPLADGSGHEFTLDLSNDILVLEQLQVRMRGAKITPLEHDLLHIEFIPMGE